MGGVILCPEDGCDCISTWSPNDAPRPSVQQVATMLRSIGEAEGLPASWAERMLMRQYARDGTADDS
jgi:hypothetical protein